MSKQFEAKKESISLINRTLSDKNTSRERELRDLREKYRILLDRTRALEKVYKFHKGIIQNISSGIITIDFTEKITFINSAALKALDYRYDELIDKSVRIIFADHQEAESILHQLMTHKNMFESKEVSLLSRTENIIPIGFSTTLLRADDPKYNGVIISFRDLTNLNTLRAQMERIDRLTTLGEVSAGIAHEIRNPLAGIKTSAQVLEESFSPNDPRTQLVRRIVKEIDRSNELLKKFFKFAKPGKPHQNSVDIESLIEGVFIILASKMKRKKIILKREYHHRLRYVYVDENQIEQVIFNLLLNAMDAIGEGGEIAVRIYDKTSVSNHTVQMIAVDIQDNGCGIDIDLLEKVFNPFYTTKTDGVGLGLSISSRLVEENGGQLNVTSKSGNGSVFTMILPAV